MQTKLNLSAHKRIIIALLALVVLTGFSVPLYNQYELQNQTRSQTELYAQQLQEQESQQAIRDQQMEDAASAIQYETAQDQIKKSTTEMHDTQINSDLQTYQEAEIGLVPYDGPIEHIFFHPLLAYPSLTFDGDADSNGFNQYFVTVSEFKKIINQIYANNYILIDYKALYDEKVEDGKTLLVHKELKLPPNKKPLILSVDDVNYPDYKSTNGTISKLILDSEGKVATYSISSSGEKVTSHDNEVIPIIDAFVAEHPDFSFQGAKGILAFTGYYGILGYNTNQLDSPSYPEERQSALAIIERLRETGWAFASHGYSHLDARAESYQRLETDTLRWNKEVGSLIGPTNIYIYPFGSSVLPGDSKFQFLLDQGFNILCSVGPTPYLKDSTNYVMMDRRHIDGIALYNQAAILKNIFDAKSVLDPVRPPLKAGQ